MNPSTMTKRSKASLYAWIASSRPPSVITMSPQVRSIDIYFRTNHLFKKKGKEIVLTQQLLTPEELKMFFRPRELLRPHIPERFNRVMDRVEEATDFHRVAKKAPDLVPRFLAGAHKVLERAGFASDTTPSPSSSSTGDGSNKPFEINIVAYSTGALVVRYFLTKYYYTPYYRHNIKHLVMFSPANYGSPYAKKVNNPLLFRTN